MTNADTVSGMTEPTDRREGALEKPDPTMTGRPASALIELTRNAAASSQTHPYPRPNGIEWVRPTDLVHRISADAMTRGADAHRNAHTWARTQLRKAITPSDRGSRLPPPSAFGTNGLSPAGRSAIGR